MIKRVDIKAILANPVLKEKMMVSVIQAIQSREGIDVTEEQALAAIYKSLEKRQKALGEDFEAAIFDNIEELYDSGHKGKNGD